MTRFQSAEGGRIHEGWGHAETPRERRVCAGTLWLRIIALRLAANPWVNNRGQCGGREPPHAISPTNIAAGRRRESLRFFSRSQRPLATSLWALAAETGQIQRRYDRGPDEFAI
jgi:hypothetical protein